MKKIKNILFALASLFVITGAASVTTFYNGETSSENQIDPIEQQKVNEARDFLYINADLNNIVSNIYLPTKGLYDSKITWETTHSRVISNEGVVRRPSAGKEPSTCTLTATLTLGSATATKEFNCRVLPTTSYNPNTSPRFEENFTDYKTGQDLANYFIWEHSGDEIATIEESVIDNNMVGEKLLHFAPLATLYKDTSYKTAISMKTSSVLETYVMTTGSISGFQIELLNGNAKVLSLGLTDTDFTALHEVPTDDGETEKVQKVIASRDNGVWYKLRFEIDVESQVYNAYYYDFKNDGALVNITPEGGLPIFAKTANYISFRVLTGRNDGNIFLSKVLLDETNKMSFNPGENPNRIKGIGYIENYVSSYLLIQYEELILPQFKIYNRFNKEQLLVEGSDYTIDKTYGESGEVNTDKVGDYTTTYTITLKVDNSTTETKVLTQTFHVDGVNDTASLDTLRIAPIVNDRDPTAEKVLKITANIDRRDSTVYYAATNQGAAPLSAEQVVNANISSDIPFCGNQKIEEASFQINILGLQQNKEYDFYVVTKNNNGISEVYTKQNISINVYNIESPDDFFFMCTDPNVQTTSFRMLNDIDFASYYWAASEITRPEYTGTFDGQGHTIKNLTIVAPYKKASLFYDFAGTFKNLTFLNCSLTGNESVGFIGGYALKEARVENVTMIDCTLSCYSNQSAGDGYYGMIFGRCEGGNKRGNIVVENVSIQNAIIDAPKYVGAIAGNVQKVDTLTLNNVYCQAVISADNAAIALISRLRSGSKLIVKNTYADIEVTSAKKEVAVIAGHLEDSLELENVVGKLKVNMLTQPTYFNTVTGRYGAAASISYKNVYFFEVDTSELSEDIITPVTASLHVGNTLSLNSDLSKEWWERNTCFNNLDTNPNWGYDAEKKSPMLRNLDTSTLSFSAEEVNYYIDLIGDVISSEDHYYIKKARELYAFVKKDEAQNVKLSVLEQAEKDYAKYIEDLEETLEDAEDIYSSLTGGIDWGFEGGSN